MENNMKTYLVGGAVRDQLLGLDNEDKDFVIVGATSKEVLALGYEQVGADFPVFLAPNGDQYALARKERKVGLGYGGFEVEFDSSVTLEEDLMRRDLTINAIAIDIETGDIHDPYFGRADLSAKILRHVSEAFAEDPLRVIRLARFASRFEGFTIAPNTIILCKNIVQSGELDSISDERFITEMEKMFNQAHDPFIFFEVLWQTGAINCKFFVDFLGGVDSTSLEEIRKFCSMTLIHAPGGNARLQIFAAYAPRSNAKMESPAIPNQLKWIRNEIKQVASIQNARDGNAVMDVLVRNRAFNDSSFNMNELILMMEVGERQDLQKKFRVSSLLLRKAIDASRSVLATDFMDKHQGAELGSVLYRERLLRVTDVLVNEDKVR
jgi:tRNA nucleotidyltransferase/poly(A) polymerase